MFIPILIATALVVAVVLTVKARSYGGLRAMLNNDLKSDRRHLASARKDVKTTTAAVNHELSAAKADLAAAEQDYNLRLNAVTTSLHSLTEPGVGGLIAVVGPVTLFEHALRIREQCYDLTGVSASCQTTSDSVLLNVRLANGQTVMEPFSTAWRESGTSTHTVRPQGDLDIIESSQRMVRSYADSEVFALANAIGNQAIQHARSIVDAPQLIQQAEAALAAQRLDTSYCDAARAQLVHVEAGSDLTRALTQANLFLAFQQQQYQAAVHNSNERRASSIAAAGRRSAASRILFASLFVLLAGAAAALMLVPTVDFVDFFGGKKVSALFMIRHGLAGQVVGQIVGAIAFAVTALAFLIPAVWSRHHATASVPLERVATRQPELATATATNNWGPPRQ